MNNIFKNKRGLGFIEMIAALGVIVTGVIAGLTLTTFNLTSSNISESKLLAANLAREAIEVIRNKRDSNWLTTINDWNQGILIAPTVNYRLIVSFNEVTNTWVFDDGLFDIEDCLNCQIYFDPDSGIYTHNVGDNILTNFKRIVTLREICWQAPIKTESIQPYGDHCPGDTLAGYYLEAQVTWTESNIPYDLTIVDKIYDWK